MDFEKLFALAKPILEKNDLGAAHTSRVLAIARENFSIPKEIEDLTVAAIILHDIGGASIKDQYEKGPSLATSILQQMGCDKAFIEQVSTVVGTHHDHPDNPSIPFRILYDSDKIVMFSPEEFPGYDSRPGFDWNKITSLLYSEKAKTLAKKMLRQRTKEKNGHAAKKLIIKTSGLGWRWRNLFILNGNTKTQKSVTEALTDAHPRWIHQPRNCSDDVRSVNRVSGMVMEKSES